MTNIDLTYLRERCTRPFAPDEWFSVLQFSYRYHLTASHAAHTLRRLHAAGYMQRRVVCIGDDITQIKYCGEVPDHD